MTPPGPASLDRQLGPLDASAIVISNVIGVGIFTTPGVVAAMLPGKMATLAVWAIGGALAFAGALATPSSPRGDRKPAASTSTCARISGASRVS